MSIRNVSIKPLSDVCRFTKRTHDNQPSFKELATAKYSLLVNIWAQILKKALNGKFLILVNTVCIFNPFLTITWQFR